MNTLWIAMGFLLSQQPTPAQQEAHVAACAGLSTEDRDLAGNLRDKLSQLAIQHAQIEMAQRDLDQARQDLIWLAQSIQSQKAEPVRANDASDLGSVGDPAQYSKLIKVVGRMKPAAASRLLLALKPALAKLVVSGLRPAQAAKILAAMTPESAAPIAASIDRSRHQETL